MDIPPAFKRLGDAILTNAGVAYEELSGMVSAAVGRFSGEFAKQDFEWLNPEVLSLAQSRQHPTFLLHGSYGSPSDWICFIKAVEEASLRWNLKAADLGPIYLLEFKGVDDGARVLRKQLLEVLAQYQVNGQKTIQPCIIGHSVGGVIAVREVFCRGMPPGIEVSDVWICASRLGLTGSVWHDGPAFFYSDAQSAIEEIDTCWDANVPTRLHHLQASHDWLVPKEARLKFGTYETIPHTSHFSIINAPGTHEILVKGLQPQ